MSCNKTNTPFFSIIVPTYNRADRIGCTLLSVLNQTYCDFELIVVDDGSTDDTAEIVKKFLDGRLAYMKKKNEERGAARNYGINLARGRYITFLDSDDRLYPHHFQVAHDFILKEKFPPFFHSGYEIRDEDSKVISKVVSKGGGLNNKLVKGNFLSCIGVFVRAEIVKKNLFNEDRALAGSEDYELWMRLACQYPLLGIPQVTAFMIQHKERSVVNFNAEKLEKRINLVRENLQKDQSVSSFYKDKLKVMSAHLDMYLALHLLMKKNRKKAFRYMKGAIKSHPRTLLTRNMLSLFYKSITFKQNGQIN